ncbi:MAG: type I restriction enzyme HsdR N-terminal domain-containing protein [Desulfobacterales bacterium]
MRAAARRPPETISPMSGHHLILGECSDFLTGESLQDTLDERYRQQLARLLVEGKGFTKSEISPRVPLRVTAGEKCAQLQIDLAVSLENAIGMIIRFGPGSLTTRHRPALAISRLLSPHQIPVVVVTNGQDADILDGFSGKRIGRGLSEIPTRMQLAERVAALKAVPVSPQRAAIESRVLYAYEVDGSCPCDESVCRL